VVLWLVIGSEELPHPENPRGLDPKAVETVPTWRFGAAWRSVAV